MSVLAACTARLLGLGSRTAHPASAIVGVRDRSGTAVHAAGWAVQPGPHEPGVAMAAPLLLDLASVTKVAATTVMIMRLVAAGLLDLNDRVCSILPAFTGAAKADITIEQLLTHTAGLPPWWPLYLETGEPDAALARAQRLPLASRPGSGRCYSDLGFIFAGAVIERITAMPLREAFRTLIAEPLGLSCRYGPIPPDSAAASADSDAYEYRMVLTGVPYPVPFSPTTARAGPLPGWRTDTVRGEANDGNAARALGGAAGHAGLFGTVDDLLRLGAALHDGILVPPAVVARFAAASAADPSQAIGFRRTSLVLAGKAVTVLQHGGFTGTFFAFAPDAELVVAGAAMRLYTVVGGIPRDGTAPHIPQLVPLDAIGSTLLHAAALHAETLGTSDRRRSTQRRGIQRRVG